jgi:chromosome segregation protein
VSIVFDNSKKIFSLTTLSNDSIKLDFDEITISREVYADGGNRYLINGSEVRLKDVHELLSSVNIGASGHHIISQGEADRILNSSARDRRGMIEDALGLKVYHYRLKESERKLEKTTLNIKEAQSLRRELAPHINFLKKQVEKVQKAEEMRKELEEISLTYLKREENFISKEKSTLYNEKEIIKVELGNLNKELESGNTENAQKEPAERAQLHDTERKLRELGSVKDDLVRKVGRIEGVIEFEESKGNEEQTDEQVIHSRSETRKFVIAICTYIAIGVFLIVINKENPWINAIVPTIGFMLSTLTLPFIKTWWKKNIYK